MTFSVKIKSPTIRETQIRSSVLSSADTLDFYDFRNCKTDLKRIRISEDLLLYRMENFRTFTEQKAYLLRENKAADFFLSGQENESVQQIQHEILAQLSRKGRADSIVPVIDVLRTEKQREPLLITYRGVVVNGNRRLAGMRELIAEDSHANQEFRHVTCLVLPEDATPEDIIEIEASLQGRPETKLDYDWIGDSQLIKRLMELGRTERDLADRLNRKPTEIRNSLAALTEANLYLKDWAKAEGDYTKVRDSEQFFKDIPSLLQGKEQGLADASRVIAWTLYDNKDRLNERLYAFNLAVGKHAADILDRMSSEMGIALKDDDEDDDDGGFNVDIDADTSETSYQPITGLLRDPVRREEAVETLIDICRGVIEDEKGKKTGSAALKAIGAANARLTEVDLGRADPSTYHTIGRQLEQVHKRVTDLKSTLDALVEASNAASGTSKPKNE
jgi:hypothetical protein